ncbi:MAG: GLPGLI family protein [Flavobacteriaceae bacterium]|nr:GLPGLI family protein [Flavobacteriaceae bacterium]
MITVTKSIVLGLLMFGITLNAQDFHGEAIYKTHSEIDIIKRDSTQRGDISKSHGDIQSEFEAILQKQFQKTFKLSFNKQESLYKEEEQLESPMPQSQNMEVMFIGGTSSNVFYKNLTEKRFSKQSETMGKLFLIQGALEKYDWELGSETKNIGNYTCFKATLKQSSEKNSLVMMKDDNLDDSLNEGETEIVAWYTPQIPVNTGPDDYHGLPGLILEVNDGFQTILCSKIVLNPKNNTEIIAPTKGKKVTPERYNEIMEKKFKEMEDRYSPNDKDGETFEIRIGG